LARSAGFSTITITSLGPPGAKPIIIVIGLAG